MFEHLDRQIEAGGGAHGAVVGPHFSQHPVVIAGIHHYGHRRVILGRRPQHSRPADVDVFNRVGQRAVRLGDRGLERIKIHHQQVDGRNAVLDHHRVILAAPA